MNIANLGRTVSGACATSMLIALAGSALANSYYVEKQFTLKPGGNGPVTVTTRQFHHAWTQDTPRNGPFCARSDVQPPQNIWGWNEYGTERMSGPSGSETNIVQGTSPRPFVADEDTTGNARPAVASGCDSYAKASSSVMVNPPIPAAPDITGTISVSGTNFLFRDMRLRKAYACSMAWVEAQGSDLINGRIKLRKTVRSFVKGVVPHGHDNIKRDPVNFRVRDGVTGQVTSGRLFAYSVQEPPGFEGEFTWESNRVRITRRDLNFTLEMPGQYTRQAGLAVLQVSNGVVTASSASGLYAGALPAVGSTVPLDFSLSNEVILDYDLRAITTNAAEVNLDMSCAGEAFEEFSGDAPALSLTVDDNTTNVSWPISDGTWQLQSCPALGAAGSAWSDVPVRPLLLDGRFVAEQKSNARQKYFRLRRLDPPPCSITLSQPQDVTAPDGGTVTFGIEALALEGPFTYQWQQAADGSAFIDIPGATAADYTRRVALPDNGAQFRCRVSNGCSSVVSAPATLIVSGPAD